MNYKLIPEDYKLPINSVRKFTKKYSRKYSKFIRKYSDSLIEVTDAEGNIAYGSDVATTAKALGCSSQLIYNCINQPQKFKSAKGCKIRVVDSATLKPIEI